MNTDELYTPQPGDIFACWGSDLVSSIISLSTSLPCGPRGVRWAPSHVAIACPGWYPEHDRCFWWESTSLTNRPCLQAGKRISGVQCHDITDRMVDYVQSGGRVSVYRLSRFDALNRSDVISLRTFFGECLAGEKQRDVIPYDTKGAIVSGTRFLRRLIGWHNQLESMFCSELLAAVLQRLNLMCRDNPAEFTPGQLMRQLIRSGTYLQHTQFTSLQDWRLRENG